MKRTGRCGHGGACAVAWRADAPNAAEIDVLADKEALQLIRAYYTMPEAQRRQIFELARVLSDAA